MEKWRIGVLPQDGGTDKRGWSLRGQVLYPILSEDGKLLTAFAIERFRDAELAEEFDRAVIGHKRDHLRHLVRAAIQRGDLPADADVDLIAEAAPAYIWHHALYGLPIADNLLERILDLVLP